MKLSEAIRKGATLRPYAYGSLFQRRGGIVCSCAIGAALDGAGMVDAVDIERIVADDGVHSQGLYDRVEQELVGGATVSETFVHALQARGLCALDNDDERITSAVFIANDRARVRNLLHGEDPRLTVADALEAVGL